MVRHCTEKILQRNLRFSKPNFVVVTVVTQQLGVMELNMFQPVVMYLSKCTVILLQREVVATCSNIGT